MRHHVAVHFDRHLVDIVFNVVVHHRVDKHEHHVTLELGRRADHATVHVLLDRLQVHRPAQHSAHSTVSEVSFNRASAELRVQRATARIDWLGFNGTFSTNRLYRAFEKYVAVKHVALLRKLAMLCVGNTYNKQLQ